MSSWVITLGGSGLRITRIDDEGLKDYADGDPDSIEIAFIGLEPKVTTYSEGHILGHITKVEWDREDDE